MYKVFINDKPIFFLKKGENVQSDNKVPVFYSQSLEERNEILNTLNKDPRSIVVIENNHMDFFNGYEVIHAAGGVVENSKGEILFILRNGKWDLPKGKVDDDEKTNLAAIREVEEECGLNKPIIENELITTYHTYQINNRSILKPTSWYYMKYAGNEQLIPQIEEGITAVKWIQLDAIEEQMENTYGAIQDVIDAYKKIVYVR